MKDQPSYLYDADWTPEERRTINNSRELADFILAWPYLSWWTKRKLMLLYTCEEFRAWVRKHEGAFLVVVIVVVMLLAGLVFRG